MLARELELATLFLDLLEQPGVVDGDGRVGGEGLEQVQRVDGNGPAACPVVGGEDPDGAAAGDHGDDEEALDPQAGERRVGRAQAIVDRQRVVLGEAQGRAVSADGGQRARLADGDRHAGEIVPVALLEAGLGGDHEPCAIGTERPHVDAVEADHLARGVEDARELLRE